MSLIIRANLKLIEAGQSDYKSAKEYLSAIDENKDRILTEKEVF